MEEPQLIKPDSRALADILTAERLRQKLSCKEVATELNLNVSIIDALENNEPIESVSATYVRGYQRAYVRFLGLDESELLDDLVDQDRDDELKQELHYIDNTLNNKRKNANGLRFLSPVILLLGLTALSVYSWPIISSFLSSNGIVQNSEQTEDVETKIILSNNDDQQSIETQQVEIQTESSLASESFEPELQTQENSEIIEPEVLQSTEKLVLDDNSSNAVDSNSDIESTQIQVETNNTNEAQELVQPLSELESTTVEPVNLNQAEEINVATDEVDLTPIQVDSENNQVTQVIKVASVLNQSDQVEQIQPETNTTALDNQQLVASKISELLDPENTTSQQVGNDEQITTESALSSVNEQDTEARITFIANGESWLSITDAENNRLYRNTLKLDRVTVTGVPPIYVSTGNVQVLRVLSEQGEQQKVDIFNDTKTVAKFFVDYQSDGSLKFIPK